MKRVAVLLATYNGEVWLEQQLSSILTQVDINPVIFISDDFSIDKTSNIIGAHTKSYSNVMRLTSKKRFGSAAANFFRLLRDTDFSMVDYVALCDQDDIWLPGKVEATIAALTSSLLVVTDCNVVDANLKLIAPSFFELRKSGAGILKNIMRNSYLGCCMAFHRSLLSDAMPMPASVPMHDMWLGLIAETKGKVCFLPKPLLRYRRHGGNASPTAGKSDFSLYRKISYRVTLCYLLLCRVLFNKLKRL